LAKYKERNGCWVCSGMVNCCAVNTKEEVTKHQFYASCGHAEWSAMKWQI
jgi:hypothetical protein